MTAYDDWLEQPYQEQAAAAEEHELEVERALDRIEEAIEEIIEKAPEYKDLIDALWENVSTYDDDAILSLAEKV